MCVFQLRLTDDKVKIYVSNNNTFYVYFIDKELEEVGKYLKFLRDNDNEIHKIIVSNMFYDRYNELRSLTDTFIFHLPDEETAFYFKLKYGEYIFENCMGNNSR